MEKQLHVSLQSELLEKVVPVTNGQFVKGLGGFWTSTYNEKLGSDWVQWCLGEGFAVPENGVWSGFILTPSQDAKILTIDSAEDLFEALEKYKDNSFPSSFLAMLDFEAMSKEYDAVHLTHNGQAETRHSRPGLYGWDCESTHWFRWCFDEVEKIQGKRWGRVYEY